MYLRHNYIKIYMNKMNYEYNGECLMQMMMILYLKVKFIINFLFCIINFFWFHLATLPKMEQHLLRMLLEKILKTKNYPKHFQNIHF